MATNGDSDRVKAWNQLGGAMGAAGDAADTISGRSLNLWSDIAHNLRQDTYTADQMSNDIARVVLTGIDNLRDIWTAAATSPVGPLRVNRLPTVEIFIAADGSMSAQPASVPAAVSDDEATTLQFRFTGTGPETADDLKHLQYVCRNGSLTFPQLALEDPPSTPLKEGLYTGLAYLPGDRNERPIAHLWVVVESGGT